MSLSQHSILQKMHHPVLRRVKLLNITAEMDLLALSHEYRMQIVQGNRGGKSTGPIRMSIFSLLQVEPDKMNIIGDTVF